MDLFGGLHLTCVCYCKLEIEIKDPPEMFMLTYGDDRHRIQYYDVILFSKQLDPEPCPSLSKFNLVLLVFSWRFVNSCFPQKHLHLFAGLRLSM